MSSVYIHSTADVANDATLGDGTKVWHEAQIRPRVVIGENCIFGKGAYIDEDVIIGSNVKIQNRASVYKDCTIEDGVFIGPHVCFTNDVYPRAINPDGTLKSADDWSAGRSLVKYGASIGAGSIILPGRTIGRFALVGAGSVVTRDVPDYGIVVGNPARLVGQACVCGAKMTVTGNTGHCPACGRSRDLDDATLANQDGAEIDTLDQNAVRLDSPTTAD